MTAELKPFAEIPIEEVQRFWDQRPCNIRHSPKPVGTREYFDDVETRKYFVEPHIPGFAEFDRWKGRRVLEIGCGIGTDTIRFARAGAEVTAVDLSERSLELARQRAAVYGLTNIRFLSGDAERLDRCVPAEPFDLVYSFGVLHHTPHPEEAFRQIKNFVRPGSTLKIMVYHRWSFKVAWIVLTYGKGAFWRLGDLVARYSEAQTGCPVTYIYSRRQIRRLLEAHGFRIISVSAEHIFPYRIPDYVEYRYVKSWIFRWMPRPVFRALERLFGWHLLVTAEAR